MSSYFSLRPLYTVSVSFFDLSFLQYYPFKVIYEIAVDIGPSVLTFVLSQFLDAELIKSQIEESIEYKNNKDFCN